LSGAITIYDSVGADVIDAGDGRDYIFGDAFNTDALAVVSGLKSQFGLPDGAGWAVFDLLEGPAGATSGPGGGQWTRFDTENYIRTHLNEVATESTGATVRSGGDDNIDAGKGDDFVFGQEGADVINADEGNDYIRGGTQGDVLTGGQGADRFVYAKADFAQGGTDLIQDFVNADDEIVFLDALSAGIAGIFGTAVTFNVTWSDSSTGSYVINFAATSEIPQAANVVIEVPPVVLDLDGDGLSLSGDADVSAVFASLGDFSLFIGQGDGLLVYDYDQDGLVGSLDEISFALLTPQLDTDLGGLSSVFDSNVDGVFDAGDSEWGSFYVWSDYNADLILDPAELIGLDRLGVTSIDLGYLDQSTPYVDQGGAVVYGQTAFTWADGSVGVAYDVSFDLVTSGEKSSVGDAVDALLQQSSAVNASEDVDVTSDSGLAVSDLDVVIQDFLASEPVTEADVAAFEQDVQLAETTDPEPLALPDGDTAVVEPVADLPIDDGSVDTDFDHDVVIDDGAVQDVAIYDHGM
jgi:hypothetical protein